MTLTSRPTRTDLAVLATASTLLLLLVGLALAPGAGAATLYACVKKHGGTARFVSARTRCRRNETKLSWNTVGPAGANGRNGANGKNGTNGANGKNGANGTSGLSGANGASAGYVDFNDSVFELPLTRASVAALPSVPPGSYILFAKAQVEDANATEGVTVHCYLAGNDESVIELADKGGSGTISLIAAGQTPFTFECDDFGTKEVKVKFARIAAIQVQTLTAASG